MMAAGMKRYRISLVFIFSVITILCMIIGFSEEGSSKTIIVDINGNGDFTSIRDAITVAEMEDEIRVWDGTYQETVLVNKTIDLIGNGSSRTFIDAGETDAIVSIAMGVTVRGFSILGGEENHDGIRVEWDSNTIVDIVSSGNRRIYITDGKFNRIENVTVFNNSLSAIFLYESDYNTIVNATCTSSAYGIHLQESDLNHILQSNCSGNRDGIGIRVSDNNAIRGCILNGNSGSGVRILYSSYNNEVYDTIISENRDGIVLGDSGDQIIFSRDSSFTNITCTDNGRFGVLILNSEEDSFDKVALTGNEIGFSFGAEGNVTSLHRSNIHGNSIAGVNATANPDLQFIAIENYWGDPSGPYHVFENSNGTGDTILGNISFSPWSTFMFALDDHTPPPSPTNLTIDRIEYFDNATNLSYFKYGETYIVTVKGPSILDDPGLSHLTFYAGNQKISEYNVSDNDYVFTWAVDFQSYFASFISVTALDVMSNGASSEGIPIKVVGDSLLDLTIANISFSNSSPGSGEKVSITVTGQTEVFINGTARSVKAKVFEIDSHGNQRYLGEIEFGDIDPSVDLFPDDPLLGPGDFQGTLFWITPAHFYHGENETYTIRVQVDPDGYVKETSEINNEGIRNITVSGLSRSPPEAYLKAVVQVGGWHDLRFDIQVNSTVRVRIVEYRFNGSEVWKSAHPPSAEADEWSESSSVWYFNYNTSSLELGDYSFEIRVYDGLYYSDPAFGDFQVLSEPSDENGEEDNDTDHTGLFILVSVVVMLILILIQQVMKNAQSSVPPGSNDQTSPDDNAGNKEASSDGTADSPQKDSEVTCEHCGSDLPNKKGDKAIRITCPECGLDSVSEQFQKAPGKLYKP